MGKLNFDIEKYQELSNDEEKVKCLSAYIFELSRSIKEPDPEILDVEVDDLFNDTLSLLRKRIVEENEIKYKDDKVAFRYKNQIVNEPLGYPVDMQSSLNNLILHNAHVNEMEKMGLGFLLKDLIFHDETKYGSIINKRKIGYKVFINFKKIIKDKVKSEPESRTIENQLFVSEKIKIKGSLQSIGFIFSEFINKGFIEVPKRSGNNNTSAISRMILEHFEFVDREKQPTQEDIRQTLFSKNSLSLDKQDLFKIPQSKIINTD